MSRAVDPGRVALVRYLADCIRAELRAQELLIARRARRLAAVQQIRDFDAASVKTAEQMTADARAAKRRGNVRRRAA